MLSVLTTLAQYTSSYNYDYSYNSNLDSGTTAAAAGVGIALILIWMLVTFAVLAVMVVSMWKLFKKAGKQGWEAIIPIYNTIVLLQIVGRPVWWIVLMLIPFVNIVVGIIVALDLAKSFGKDAGLGIVIALFPIIGYPILAFGDAKYKGPAGPEPAAQ